MVSAELSMDYKKKSPLCAFASLRLCVSVLMPSVTLRLCVSVLMPSVIMRLCVAVLMPSVTLRLCLSVLILSVGQVAAATEEQIDKRVHAHMVIGDYPSASSEAQKGLELFPSSKILRESYIRALAKAGDEKEMMVQWHLYIKDFPDECGNREILERLAWAVIDKGATSPSPLIRVIAMLGAFFSQDAKGVVILQSGLRDENSFLRSAAIKLSSNLHDISLQEELLRLMKSDPVWDVRLQAIKAVGHLQLVDAKNALEALIGQDNSHIEEKTAAIQALVLMADGISRERINELVQSNRVGLRLLACEFVIHFDQTQDIDLLFPLVQDYHAAVRAKVFQTLGCLGVKTIAGHSVVDVAGKGVTDPDPLVQVSAAWVLTLADPERGCSVFRSLLENKTVENRYLAAAALAGTGKYGLPLSKEIFAATTDSYIKMNLAMGLIGQRVSVAAACDCLFTGLSQEKKKWAWRNEGQFRILAPSKVKHDDAIPNYPEAVNQLTRLEILEILSILHYSHAQEAIRRFLKESNWGISGLASALLLTEGDESAIDLVKALLKENDQKVKIQAALILALWGKGEDVICVLQEAYPTADRDLKGQILEGIGRVGSQVSLSFLTERLQEPHQTLRIIAAAALLECLYH